VSDLVGEEEVGLVREVRGIVAQGAPEQGGAALQEHHPRRGVPARSLALDEEEVEVGVRAGSEALGEEGEDPLRALQQQARLLARARQAEGPHAQACALEGARLEDAPLR
jgi:hypothetical protein